jgi:RimJ/RimL family protein N-acetyltransferase
MTDNRATVALYEKAGFVVEGTRRDSMLLDGSYVDEYYGAKLLE